MPPLDIQRSKLIDTIATSTRCKNTLNFMLFVIIVGNTSLPKQSEKEIQHVGIIIRPTFATKYFHKWKGPCTPYEYTTSNL
jgi:hypothetical protein